MITPATAQPGGERDFVRRLAELLGTHQPRSPELPFGDDMAGIPGHPALAWTTDVLLDGVHFQSDRHAWSAVGRKAMAVNLSDCAAMAGRPLGALCAITASTGMTMEDLLELERGAQQLGLAYECPIVGGNTSSWNHPAMIAITLAADFPNTAPVLRSGAEPGDTLWVSGPLGGSLLGRHLWFEPRVREAQEIRRLLPLKAMMDFSDGLVIDLSRMLEASGCGAVLDRDSLERVIHPDARQLSRQDLRTPLEHALYDGEDFELLLALAPGAPVEAARALGLMPIGRMTENSRELLMEDDGRTATIPMGGWEHLK